MIYVYMTILALQLLLLAQTRHHKKELFTSLDRKEHPLWFLYTASASIYDFLRKYLPHAADDRHIFMKRLYVRENVDVQMYLCSVKKTATLMSLLLVTCTAGMLFCLSTPAAAYVTSLARAGHGEGDRSYVLEAEYNGTEETVEINIAPNEYTEAQIRELFDASLEGIRSEVLGENASFDRIDRPLKLISRYGDIRISWELNDNHVLDYDGSIRNPPEEGAPVLITLTALLELEGIRQAYPIPALITAPLLSEQEALIEQIRTYIRENSSAYDEEVSLPAEIEGRPIRFRTTSGTNQAIFLILALPAAILLFIGYDRRIEDRVRKRDEEMLRDFPEIVSKLSLLFEAGLSIYRSFERIVADHEEKTQGRRHYAYLEMRLMLEEIRNGMGEAQAYQRFGRRCGLHPYIKLGNLLEQNLNKGSRGMQQLLKQEAEDSLESRKRLARKMGEEASTKMLAPMVMMLAVVLIIVTVPALMSIRF